MKTDIILHRSYRRLELNRPLLITESLLLVLLLGTLMFIYLYYVFPYFISLFYTQLQHCSIDVNLVSSDIYGISFILLDLSYAELPTRSKIIIFAILIMIYILLFKQKFIPYNIVMWLNFFILLFAIFVLYFIFFSANYPYTLLDFQKLYLFASFGFIFFSGIVIIIVFTITPIHYLLKITIFILTMLYFMIFSIIRFALLILLSTQLSVIFTPVMFFTLYLDFFFFVSIYSYVLYLGSKKMKHKGHLWTW